MSKTETHECSACGGTGLGKWIPTGELYGRKMPARFGKWEVCPVCSGSGRISDVMPVNLSYASRAALRVSQIDGEAVAHLASRGGSPDAMYWQARRSARAAFRACPGLRGE